MPTPKFLDVEAVLRLHARQLAKNHPFVDGNKRTAFAVADTLLRINGTRLSLTDNDAYDLVMQVAQGQVDKATLADILAGALEPRC